VLYTNTHQNKRFLTCTFRKSFYDWHPWKRGHTLRNRFTASAYQ